jgi:hypothetical protein
MPMRVHCSGRRLRFGPFGRLAGRKGREEFPEKKITKEKRGGYINMRRARDTAPAAAGCWAAG